MFYLLSKTHRTRCPTVPPGCGAFFSYLSGVPVNSFDDLISAILDENQLSRTAPNFKLITFVLRDYGHNSKELEAIIFFNRSTKSSPIRRGPYHRFYGKTRANDLCAFQSNVISTGVSCSDTTITDWTWVSSPYDEAITS